MPLQVANFVLTASRILPVACFYCEPCIIIVFFNTLTSELSEVIRSFDEHWNI